MANHAWVKTKKQMTPDGVTNLLNTLNENQFKGVLKIEYFNEHDNPAAWGPHVWMLNVVYKGREYGSRVCWLKTKRHFEIRHGGGSDFIWWIDGRITDEIARQYNGHIYDEGVGKLEIKPEGYSFNQMVDDWHKGFGKVSDLERQFFRQEAEKTAPPPFRRKWDTKVHSSFNGLELKLWTD